MTWRRRRRPNDVYVRLQHLRQHYLIRPLRRGCDAKWLCWILPVWPVLFRARNHLVDSLVLGCTIVGGIGQMDVELVEPIVWRRRAFCIVLIRPVEECFEELRLRWQQDVG